MAFLIIMNLNSLAAQNAQVLRRPGSHALTTRLTWSCLPTGEPRQPHGRCTTTSGTHRTSKCKGVNVDPHSTSDESDSDGQPKKRLKGKVSLISNCVI